MKAFIIGFGLAWWLSAKGYLTAAQLQTVTTAATSAVQNAATPTTSLTPLSGHWDSRKR